MSFFIRDDNTGPRPGRGRGKRPFNGKKTMSRYQKRDRPDEEVESSESDVDGDSRTKKNGHNGHISSDDDEMETALEKRHRLAKEYLKRIEAEEKHNANGEDGLFDAVTDRLDTDLLERSGRLHREIAEKCRPAQSSEFKVLRGHQGTPTCICISKDGRFAVTGSKDGSLIKWSLSDGTRLVVVRDASATNGKSGHTGCINCVALSDSEEYLFSGGDDKKLHVWNFATMQHIRLLSGHLGPITGLVTRPKTNQLYSCGEDRTVKVWDTVEMGYIEALFGHTSQISDIHILFRERAITCGGSDRTVRIWKLLEASQLVFNCPSTCSSVECVRYINEEHFVTGYDNGNLSIWSVMRKTPVFSVYKAHSKWVISLATEPFTDLIASGSHDGFIKLWRCSKDYKSLSLCHSIEITGFVNALAFGAGTRSLLCVIGQEHKNGRWWREKPARNSLVVCPLVHEE